MRLHERLDNMTATFMVSQGPEYLHVTDQIRSKFISFWYVATVQDLFHNVTRVTILCMPEDVVSNGTYDPLLLYCAPMFEDQFDDVARKIMAYELFGLWQ
jgi:hypothetical protein